MSPSDGRPRPALALGVVALCAAALLRGGAVPAGQPDARPWPPPRPATSDIAQDAPIAQDGPPTRPWPPPKPATELSGLL